MGAQSSLLTLAGVTGLGAAKIAEAAVDAAKAVDEKEEPEKKPAVKEVDENKQALQEASLMLKKADAEEDINKLKGQYNESNAELKKWKQGLVDVGDGHYMSTNDDLSSDIKMRSKSLKVLKEKIKAKKIQIDTYKKMLGGKK